MDGRRGGDENLYDCLSRSSYRTLDGFTKPRDRVRIFFMTPARCIFRFRTAIAYSGDVRWSMLTPNLPRTPPRSAAHRRQTPLAPAGDDEAAAPARAQCVAKTRSIFQ